jgi:hypothetical protein
MSKKSRRPRQPRSSPLGGYINYANQKFPDYVSPDAPCDAQGCTEKVTAGRTLTWVAQDGTPPRTVLVRVCTAHGRAPIAELAKLLPGLPSVDSGPYLDLRDGAEE